MLESGVKKNKVLEELSTSSSFSEGKEIAINISHCCCLVKCNERVQYFILSGDFSQKRSVNFSGFSVAINGCR